MALRRLRFIRATLATLAALAALATLAAVYASPPYANYEWATHLRRDNPTLGAPASSPA